MKKKLSIFLIFFIMLTNFVNVFAAPHKKMSTFSTLALSSSATLDTTVEKDVDVDISADITKVNVGDTVQLRANTIKHGSDYTDNWVDATKVSTAFDSVYGEYISTAIYTAESPGTYTITYSINMSSGANTSKFSGSNSITIEVVDPVTVIGAELRNIKSATLINSDGSIRGYVGSGEVYALYSNGTSKNTGITITYTLTYTEAHETDPEKMVKRNVGFTLDGVYHTFPVYEIIIF